MTPNVQLARRGLGSRLPLYSEPQYEYSGHPLSWREAKGGCVWIMHHEMGATDSTICGAPTEHGHSFCKDHEARVFVKREGGE